MKDNKPLVWVPGALNELSKLPERAREEFQFELEKVRLGGCPNHWKPLDEIESGVREIRVRTKDGQFRTYFLQKYPEAVYVLGCAAKKKPALSTCERRAISHRYKSAVRNRSTLPTNRGVSA